MPSHPHAKAYAALVAVCFFWGTTYLAIRMALESFPPLLLVAARFLLSGSLMVGAAMARGAALPRGRELWGVCVSGLLILGCGNSALVFAEIIIPSGMAGLFITLSPFWMVGLEAGLPGGAALHAPTIGGMLVGLAGVALLVAPAAAGHQVSRNLLYGFLLLQAGSASWSLGSILQRRRPSTAHPFVNGAIHQLATGLFFALVAALVPESPVHWTPRGVFALLYLVTFGSIVGYSAYIYALDRLPVAVVSIYPYVNSVVAVALGWLVYREPFGWREAAAMLIIFAGVALVKRTARS